MNLSNKLENFLDNEFLTVIKQIGKYADLYGVNAYIIGGAVRDLLLDKPIYDVDIVVEGNAIKFCQFLQEKQIGEVIKEAEAFCTVKVRFNNKSHLELDFASTRTESYPLAGHLPVVDKIGCNLKEDIFRRDFRANALALKINKSDFGLLIDYTNGLEDIEKKELKILHDKSFIDDPTRIIRGLRFCHKLGFRFEEQTKCLKDDYLVTFNNNDICYERIKQVIKLAFNLNSLALLKDFVNDNIWKLICDKLPDFDMEKLHNAVIFNKKYISQDNIWLVYFAAFLIFSDVQKFNLSSKEIEIVDALNTLLQSKKELKSNLDIYNFFKDKPVESIIAYEAFDKNNYSQKYLSDLKNIKPIINGQILIKLGFSQGKIIGDVLNKILEQKLNSQLTTLEDEINFAKKFL